MCFVDRSTFLLTRSSPRSPPPTPPPFVSLTHNHSACLSVSITLPLYPSRRVTCFITLSYFSRIYAPYYYYYHYIRVLTRSPDSPCPPPPTTTMARRCGYAGADDCSIRCTCSRCRVRYKDCSNRVFQHAARFRRLDHQSSEVTANDPFTI